jgi:uncharacterized protein (DUF2147 family)
MIKELAFTVVFAMAASAAFAGNPVEGIWQTSVDDNGNYGHIEVKPCGDAFCGVLIKSFDGSGKALASDNIGKRIIWDMKPAAEGSYDSGKIWSPDRDKTYASKLQLSGDSLAVQGCVMFICRDGGTWTRVK